MFTFSITYTCKQQLKFAANYKWSACGKCYNAKTGRLIKQIVKNGCIGYVINSKFYSAKYLRTQLEKIKEVETPF